MVDTDESHNASPPSTRADAPVETTPTGDASIWSLGFFGLVATQFLTAANDNIFRWLVIGIGKDYVLKGDVSLLLTVGTILMAGTACIVMPFLFLAAPAGYLADRFSKRSVIIGCKIAEILLMALGVAAILSGEQVASNTTLLLLFAALTLMGGQSALFSPARSGALPETLHPKWLSLANGLFALAGVFATVVGMVVGSMLADWTKPKGLEHWELTAAVLVGTAVVGTLTSLLIPKIAAANPNLKFPWSFPAQTFRDLQLLWNQPALFRVALGILFFFSIGSLAQLNIDQLATEGGGTTETAKVPLLIALIAGVCVGSVLAGIWSGDHVELGLLPLGALGMAIGSILLFTVPGHIFEAGSNIPGGLVWACALLCFLGTSAGLFDVPLESYLQQRSPRDKRGSILAASNFLTFSGILLASVLFATLRLPFWKSSDPAIAALQPLFTSQQIFLLAGLFTLPVFVYIVWLIPQASLRFFVWLLSMTIYRMRVYGRENLPREGGALLVPNHITWVDGILLLLASSRPIRMVALSSNIENHWLKWLANMFGVIPINPAKPKMVVTAFKTARQALNDGELVCIFAEGGLTRSGQVQAFRPGMMKILEGTTAPVVPVYFEGLWGSIFSFEGNKFFWKWPKRIPYPLSIHFGPAVTEPDDIHKIRQAVLDLGAVAVKKSVQSMLPLPRLFIRRCKERLKQSKVADSMGADMTGADTLLRALILRRLLRRHVIKPDEKCVGVLLPPSVPGFLANMALALDKRVSVNLNYTVSPDVMNACIKQAGIKHVLTSRRFMEKMEFKLDAEIIELETLKDKPTAADKAIAALQTYVLPASCVEWSLGLNKVKSDDIVTIIFTSGSTGTPKGVMLSYGNVGTNVDAIDQVVKLKPSDVLIGILPFFHSFGYTVTMWGPAALNIKGAWHYSPLEAKMVAKLVKRQGGTLLLSTPTFLRSYLRRIEPEDFKTLDVVVAGAEKLPQDLIQGFEERFGVRPVEGYGTTELSPLVSVNIPPSRSVGNFQVDRKEGSVGRTVPGVSAKITDLDTGKVLAANKSGMLWITGPNVMQGYLDQPELTSQVIKDGWYQTGDVAYIDDDGFIFITGRESRFSKIGGEMVPHIKIEETLFAIIGGEHEKQPAVVTAIPDSKKGERLIVLHLKLDKSVDELRKGLTEAGLPNLFIPSADSFLEVPELPILGTGKLDLKEIRSLAQERFVAE
ncbi:Bifunctional protein Aas [Anatilimnocola aggregata]|uniref:Bifunctional protein Aas n=1 Tax=Anatilimnocola aggregata TaxID=2528021 RepID=A0A517YAQ3_9BACT|nr:acyl-[ACP]--phospholipid O-acyltransferase [Anatilimnocola aggregata]QDU27308.1 Bifunctional protein Aas [Anatilimnocola aggregata]